MKNVLITFLLFVTFSNSFGQTYSPPIEFLHSAYSNGFGSKIYSVDESGGITSLRIAVRGNSPTFTDALYIQASDVLGNGNVGIGTNFPTAKLTVLQQAGVGSSPKNYSLLCTLSGYTGSSSIGNTFKNNIWLVRNTAGADWTTARLHDGLSIDGSFRDPQTDTKTWWERDPNYDVQAWGTAATTYMTINHGNVGIGTKNPQETLSVNGNIRSKQVKVETANWPDYVFKDDYKLPTLKETERHIKENGHLSGIPSADEVKTNGIDLGEMNAKLLQKIEELTLHLIEQGKAFQELNNKLEAQQMKLEKQQKEINDLKR